MPQQSLHEGLFPGATSMGVKPTKLTKASGIAGMKALSLVTNPSWSVVGNATYAFRPFALHHVARIRCVTLH